jgi:hypothetical protein
MRGINKLKRRREAPVMECSHSLLQQRTLKMMAERKRHEYRVQVHFDQGPPHLHGSPHSGIKRTWNRSRRLNPEIREGVFVVVGGQAV